MLCLALALLLGLVLVPFRFEGTLSTNERYVAEIDVSWLWGIISSRLIFLPQKKSISLKLFRLKIITYIIKPTSAEIKKEKALKKAQKKAKKQANKAKKKEKKRKPSFSEILEELSVTAGRFSLEALREILLFLLHLFSSLKIRIAGEAEVGLTNPADTGLLMGVFYAINGVFKIAALRLYPNWDEPALKGNVTLSARVWLFDIMKIAIRTVFAPSIRRIWWPYIKEKLNPFSRTKKPQIVTQ